MRSANAYRLNKSIFGVKELLEALVVVPQVLVHLTAILPRSTLLNFNCPDLFEQVECNTAERSSEAREDVDSGS